MTHGYTPCFSRLSVTPYIGISPPLVYNTTRRNLLCIYKKQLSFWRVAACGECFPPVCLKPFWRISSPFPTSPPFLPEPAIFYHICLPNRCAHVRLSNTTSPTSVTSVCVTGLKAAASSALTLSSRSFPSSCSPLTMQPTVPIPAYCRLLLPISLTAKASGTIRKQWVRTLFLCVLLLPCPLSHLLSSMKDVRCSTARCWHPFPTKERSTQATKS